MNAGELAVLTASGLEALTAGDLTGSSGSDTESAWTEAQILEVMSELDTLVSQVGALQTAISDAVSAIISHGDSNWKTAEGFATPEDVQLTTTTETVDLSELKTYGDTNWRTAEGFATPEDVQITVDADGIEVPTAEEVSSAVWSANERTLSSVEGLEIASSSDAAELKTYLQLIISLAGHWTLSGSTLHVYNSDSSEVGTWTVVRDSLGRITQITPN